MQVLWIILRNHWSNFCRLILSLNFLFKHFSGSGIKYCIYFEKSIDGWIGRAADFLLDYMLSFGRKIHICEGIISVVNKVSVRVGVGIEFGWWRRKRWFFWRSFVFFRSKISVMFLCCRGDIVKILCSRWINPWRCRYGFWSGHLWKFKSGGLLWF